MVSHGEMVEVEAGKREVESCVKYLKKKRKSVEEW
jgi:hypothetical protein